MNTEGKYGPALEYEAKIPAGEVCEAGRRSADIQSITDFLLDYAINLMAAGAYTARVVKNVRRIGEAYGYTVDIILFQKNMTMTVACPEDYSIRRTYVRKQSRFIHVNFRMISDLSALSWKAYDVNISFKGLEKEYNEILAKPHENWKLLLILTSLATAAFCRLFGGDIGSVLIVFVAAAAGFSLRKLLTFIKVDPRVALMFAAGASSLTAYLGSALTSLTATADIALATSVLYLVPGVHFINSVIDILDGHILIGISRAVNTFILIMCIAFGMYFTLAVSSGWAGL